MMSLLNKVGVLAVVGLTTMACSNSLTDAAAGASPMAMTTQEDKDLIWGLEQRIYADRATGSMDFYLSVISDDYLGWPAPAPIPVDTSALRSVLAEYGFPAGEKISAKSNGIEIDGDTAVSYFSTHRTVMPGGELVDQRYDNIHVWTRKDGEWFLVGAMSRKKD